MGNVLGGKRKRRPRVMKIDGSTVKVRPPAAAGDVLRDHPGHVLLDSDQVRHVGVRATPLHPDHPLLPGKLYFLVQLPDPPSAAARRVRSAINVSAKDRLEGLMLSRRSASDVAVARAAAAAPGDGGEGAVRVRVRLPSAQVARLLEESGDPAEKIVELCVGAAAPGGTASGGVLEKKEKRTRFSTIEEQIIS